jgi:hypothetical protein
MEQSIYLEEVKKYFPSLTAKIVQRLNDTTNPKAVSYLHRSMLRKEYSANLKWESMSVAGSIVAADVIALDSSLPLKRRDSIARANGDIPKLGMEMALREKELTDLGIIARTPGRYQDLLAKLFSDTQKVIAGQYEVLEYMFLLGLSSGVTVIADANNVGTGIRIDYGYLAANKFGVPVVWSNAAAATPFTDISSRLMNKAQQDGNSITTILLDQATFNNIAKTTEAKQLYSFSVGFAGSITQVPTLSQMNAMTKDRFGWVFQIVERTVKFEKNGVKTNLKPWTVGSVVAITDNQVGTLTWGTLAEMEHPVENVNYQTVEDFILVSKYRMNRPSLAEFTSSQALVLPVIDGVDSIYLMDSTTVQA